MTLLEQYFDKIFVINLDRRTDRWEHCLAQFAKYGLTTVERFSGYDGILNDGIVNGNCGCTASHRALLEIIAYNKWPRVLVLEDDFEFIHDDFHNKFESMAKLVPDNWDMFYLGGHYAEAPVARVNAHVIKMGRMFTTSSYGITHGFARKIAPYISGVGPIDSLYGGFHAQNNCYILQPRLVVQYPGMSDLTGQHNTNEHCMLDTRHENMV